MPDLNLARLKAIADRREELSGRIDAIDFDDAERHKALRCMAVVVIQRLAGVPQTETERLAVRMARAILGV